MAVMDALSPDEKWFVDVALVRKSFLCISATMVLWLVFTSCCVPVSGRHRHTRVFCVEVSTAIFLLGGHDVYLGVTEVNLSSYRRNDQDVPSYV